MTTSSLRTALDATQASIDLARGGVTGTLAAAHNFTIQPAHDPGIMCCFTIPRPDNEPDIEFTVRRLEYLPPEHAKAYDRWLRKRNADEAAWSGWLVKVANGTAGDDETAPPEVHPVTPGN